ncbi:MULTISPECIES: VWD domain-containing protein [Arthrobacter]|uniref:VWD domain-containing protein n=2 Tax=Arthrobacter TaxID=1663 RepID=A0ABU9KL78_9MICC|nr:VWD domain-containing protein [Arthrobacter sp. YJM1]MDP5227659.1 VWD domain-containing protein [Arthrobacter sp. YJM1]
MNNLSIRASEVLKLKRAQCATIIICAIVAGMTMSLMPAAASASQIDTTTQISGLTIGDFCEPNSKEAIATDSIECIGGTARKTRQNYVKSECLLAPGAYMLHSSATYEKGACGMSGRGVEAIAQARYVVHQNINSPLGTKAPIGVSPGIQWEMGVGSSGTGGRADVVEYDDSRSDAPLNVLEVKTVMNGGVAAALQSADRYIGDINRSQKNNMFNARRSPYAYNYRDSFKIHVDDCGQGVAKKPLYEEYAADSQGQQDGALVVTPVSRDRCVSDKVERVPLKSEEIGPYEDESTDDSPKFYATPKDGEPSHSGENIWDKIAGGVTEAFKSWGDFFRSIKPRTVCVKSVCVRAGLLELNTGEYFGSMSNISRAIKAHSKSVVFGEPHLVSLDGTAFDIMSVGEFVLTESSEPEVPYDFRIQARFQATPSGTASFLNSIAMRLNDHKVEMGRYFLKVDGADFSNFPENSYLYLGQGSAIIRDGNSFTAIWPGMDDKPMVGFDGWTVQIHLPEGLPTRGLLGNNDGLKGNDFVTRDGRDLGVSPSAQVLHNDFGDSWRLNNSESLFSYGPGQSSATFTDRSFPHDILKISDFPAQNISSAQTSCAASGVPEGPALQGCILDILLTGDAPTYAALAAQIQDSNLSSVGEKHFSLDGTLLEDFEGSVASNLDPFKVIRDPALGSAAGPLSGERPYSFTVSDVPRHYELKAEFDLILLGDWNGRDTHLALTVDGRSVWSRILPDGWSSGPVETGHLSTGESYAKYRVSTTFPHTSVAIKASIEATGVVGTYNSGLAIDNLRLVATLEQPQQFQLPADGKVAREVPVSGAGFLETPASLDSYAFTAPEEGLAVILSWSQCPSAGVWRLQKVSPDRSLIASGKCRDGSARLPVLKQGAYRWEVEQDQTGSYRQPYAFYAQAVSLPDVFSLPLNGAQISDGVPGRGAGNLESVVASDVYKFEVPSEGKRLFLEWGSCTSNFQYSWTAGPLWSIYRTSDRHLMASGLCSSGQSISPQLEGGNYTLDLTSDRNLSSWGSYRLTAVFVPDAQVFALPVDGVVVSDGVPGVGAGKLETKASKDTYTLTVPAGGKSLFLDFRSCLSNVPAYTSNGLLWQVVNVATGVKVAGDACRNGNKTVALAEGDYRLEFTSDLAYNSYGTYSFAGKLG